MKITRIDHVGIYVRDVDASRRLWQECLGLEMTESYSPDERPLKLSFYPVGESLVELISGTTDDSPHRRMVVSEGKAGLNHLCLEVDDIDGALAELSSKGIGVTERFRNGPLIGHGGRRIAFLDPAQTEGCLIELCQLATVQARGGSGVCNPKPASK